MTILPWVSLPRANTLIPTGVSRTSHTQLHGKHHVTTALDLDLDVGKETCRSQTFKSRCQESDCLVPVHNIVWACICIMCDAGIAMRAKHLTAHQ